jgi:hypothetical protein
MHLKSFALGLLSLFLVLAFAGCSLVDSQREGDAPVQTPDATAGAETTGTGTLIIDVVTDPPVQAGTFQFTGVPTGTIPIESTLVVTDLEPGTYTSTQVDPTPNFDVSAVECDDEDSASPSSGDAQTRTAVFNLEQGETVRCTFTNTQRASAVIVGQTIPDRASGSFQFTGVPTGTIPTNGTLVVANLEPGTYTSTQVDPAPEFDVTRVDCDDGGSSTPSSGDSQTRTAIFNLDPGEMVRCTFTSTRRGSAVIVAETDPASASGAFQFTGVPTGTVSANGTLVVANLTPGTYTSTQVDPAPDFELTDVACDDAGSATPSSGDAQTRTAVLNVDPGETVRCTFTNKLARATGTPAVGSGNTEDKVPSPLDGTPASGGSNPFDDPDASLTDFPLPEELPPDAGTYTTPKPGPWSAKNLDGQMTCGSSALPLPASSPESGTIEVKDGGQTLVGTGLEEGQAASITLHADPEIVGRYTGSIQGREQGVPVTIDHFWQVVTDEYIVGYLTASVTAEGVTCTVYRPYELRYAG